MSVPMLGVKRFEKERPLRNLNRSQKAGEERLGTEPMPSAAPSPVRRAEVDDLNERASVTRRRDYAQLLALSEQAFELACQLDERGEQYAEGMGVALGNLAHRSTAVGEWADALSQGAQALALLGPEPSVMRGEVLGAIGWSHFCTGEYAEALEYLASALAVAEQTGDRSLQAYMLDWIGSVQASSGHNDVALEAQEQSLAIHRELGDRLGEARVRNNMAYTQMDLGDLEGGLDSALAALEYAEHEDNGYFHVGVLDTVAESLRRLGRLDEAERYACKTLALARDLGSEADEATAMMALARLRCASGSWNEALNAAQRALVLARRRSLSVEEFQCHELLSRILEQQGDYQSALEHHRRFHELKEARLSEETQKRLINWRVQAQLENAKKDAEIHRLRNLALEREVEERRVAQARLEARASLDPLTGLFNRGHLEVLAEDLGMAAVAEKPVSLLMFDIDRFKSVNDTYGHVGGDRVLQAITGELRANARQSDVACRYGGDEFLVLLEAMDAEGALSAAERLREVVAATPVAFGDVTIPVTISVGVATALPGEKASLDMLIERADRALYRAKQSGRDRVEFDGPGPLPHAAA